MKSSSSFFLENRVDAILWKEGFYSEFQQLKKQLREGGNRESDGNESIHQQMIDAINNGIVFYQQLLEKTDPRDTALVYSITIRLGDLHRYAGMEKLSQTSSPSTSTSSQTHNNPYYKASKSYYMHAQGLDPHQGMAYHGLALLATYELAHCRAIYYYLRSAICRIPQKTAIQNIRVELENNKRTLMEIVQMQNATASRNSLHKKQSVNVCNMQFLEKMNLHLNLNLNIAIKYNVII